MDILEIVYWGIFVDLPIHELKDEVKDKHITFGFRTEMPDDLLGKKVTVTLAGYGCSDTNEGYRCTFEKEYEKYYLNECVPHITLATANGGKPFATRSLAFKDIHKREIEGRFGYFGEDGEVYFR